MKTTIDTLKEVSARLSKENRKNSHPLYVSATVAELLRNAGYKGELVIRDILF